MRRIIFKLLIIVVPLGLTVTTANYLVDPANIFSVDSYVKGIANVLVRGHNVDNLTNYDERLLQEQMIKLLQKTPDIIVLGSSRVMEINSSFFPGKKVLNCGVSHGNVNDLISIVGALDSLNRLPREVIIGIDHMLISDGGTQEWQSLYPYHKYMTAKKLGTRLPNEYQLPSPFRKVSALFSLDYFQSSLQFILKGKSKQYVDVGTNRPRIYGRFSDGTVCYSAEYTNPNRVKLTIDAKIKGRKEGLPMPEKSRISLLEGLIDFLQKKQIKVHLIMVPYHPAFYKSFRENHNEIEEQCESVVRNVAATYNVPLSGSFDADTIGMPETDFYDILHCSGESIKRYIQIQ